MYGSRNVREWAAFQKAIRAWLDSRGYLEVSTSYVVPAGAFESTIDTLTVRWKQGTGELHTSPEIEMKRLIAESRESVYQICHCFRDDPTETGIHLKEFHMLEFYRVGADENQLLEEVKALFEHLFGNRLSFATHSVSHLADLDPDSFFRKMIESVEPSLDPEIPTIVRGYPGTVSALAAVDEEGLARRFEIYWHGMELCNGCAELVDLGELLRRIEEEARLREAEGKAPHPLPQDLIATLERGLPQCAGVAVGLDRLFVALQRARRA